ncbi:hypothetical protein F5Y08DRAFT_343391 [Xylaria arbuscula]|nr:hypothetical protein F5Y08DRAFT_343391 [Xylaria arbuscula]
MKFSGRMAILTLITLSANAAAATIKRQNGPVDPSTDPDCTYYDTAYDSSNDCSYFEEWWGAFACGIRCNPSVKDDCSGILVDNSYCVEVTRKPTPTTSSSTTTPGPTGSPKPSPTQDGLIEPCTNFYKSVKADTCDKVVGLYGTFTAAQFNKWNPQVGSDCKGLYAGYNVCVKA